MGINSAIWSKNGIDNIKRAIRKEPLTVLAGTLTSSAGVIWSLRFNNKSGESKSVKSSVGPMGILERAFLIQKTNIIGRAAKPIKIQPRESLRISRVKPPIIRISARMMLRIMTGFW